MLNPSGIGIISTIRYRGTLFERSFRNGVGNPDWWGAADPRDNLGYDIDGSLKDAVISFNNDPNVGLIVTVGGVAPAISARKHASIAFLSLIGGLIAEFPGTITSTFWGGVNLDTFAHNVDRFDYLTGAVPHPRHHFSADQICLLVNPKSACANDEIDQWPSPPRGQIFSASTRDEITQAFNNFGPSTTLLAMIISADPWFQDDKDFLIGKANDYPTKHICYPLQEYANTSGHPHPIPHKHSRHGPSLATAYSKLGEKARTVITNGAPSTLEPATPDINE